MFRSIVELQTAINRYIAEHNNHPKPFAWTKTPGQILTQLNPRMRQCTRVGPDDGRSSSSAWAMAQPEGPRFELVEARVVAMAPERAGHARLKSEVWLALSDGI